MDNHRVAEMKSVHDIIMQLRKTAGSKAKIQILQDNKANGALKTFLYHTYEPTISYYQTTVPVVPPAMMADKIDLTYDTIDEIIMQLAEREITGQNASFWLGDLYNNLSEDWMRDLIKILIGRDLKAGVKIKTINKVWPKLLTDEPYMRCTLPKKVNLLDWPWHLGIDSEIKYDGTYANIFINVKDANLDAVKSRNGSVYLNDPFRGMLYELHIIAESLIKNFPQYFKNQDVVVFNGELEMLDPKGNLMPRAEGNGKFNSLLQSGEIPHGHTANYKIWDFIPGTNFEEGLFAVSRRERKAALAVSCVPSSGPTLVEVGKSKLCFSYAEAAADFKANRALGLEGSIIKHPDGIWKKGTSPHQVKMKNEAMFEVELVKFNAGSGKNADLYGSITFKSRDDLLEVDATGFTDEMRQWFHENRDTLIGTIHTLIGNELTKPKKPGEKWSVFLPRWDHQRLDKTEADSLQEIIDIFANVMSDEEEDDE